MKTKYFNTTNNVTLPKFLSVALFVCAFAVHINAQAVVYTYDNNGNRIDPRLASAPPNAGIMAPAKPKDTVNVYPNPTAGQVNVTISSLSNCGQAMVYLLDASGNVLSTLTTTQSPLLLDLSSYPQGQYFVRVMVCGNMYTNSVVKTSTGTSPVGNPVKKVYRPDLMK